MGRKQDFYDPYTMQVKEIGELIPELSKLVMSKLPGSPALATVWSAFCEASHIYSMADKVVSEHAAGTEPPDYYMWMAHGRREVASHIIRKIADGMGVSNFKLRDVEVDRLLKPETET